MEKMYDDGKYAAKERQKKNEAKSKKVEAEKVEVEEDGEVEEYVPTKTSEDEIEEEVKKESKPKAAPKKSE